jgi:hypothetical protein
VYESISVVDNAMIAVWVYPQRKMIHHQIKAHCHGQNFRDALTKGTAALVQHRATKWLSDDRNNGAVLAEDAAWAQSVWFPRTKSAGWRYWGVVQPAKIIGQMNMARFVKECAAQGISARMFADPNTALAWLDASG